MLAILIHFSLLTTGESEKLLKVYTLLLGVYFLLDIQDFTPQMRASIDTVGYFFSSVANSRRVSAPQLLADLNQ